MGYCEQVSHESSQPVRPAAAPLKVSYVPGVTPGKWISRWNERQGRSLEAQQVEEAAVLEELAAGRADLVFLRIPEDGFQRPEGLHAIPLYREQPVVAAPKDHPVAAFEELALADLAGENVMDPADLGGVAMGLEVVASGVGLLILPMSVARIHSRRDIIARPVQDAPGTRIAVAWREESEDPDVEEFIGIVRGRTANSSRQPSAQAEPGKKARRGSSAGERSGQGSAGKTQSGSKTGRGKAAPGKQARPGKAAGTKPPRRRPGKGR